MNNTCDFFICHFLGCYWGCVYRVMVRFLNSFDRNFQMEFFWLPLHLKGAYPMSGGIKTSPLLPIWKIYYINGIDTFLEKKCDSSIYHFIIISIKNTCAEVYIIHWHMLVPFGNNSLAQQLQLETVSLQIYKSVYP